ncbi:hypothetical protein [Kitasatospora aureofaciens]|uniref:hypothetical protein n=1 Tax=Kitasatospora aureofaciens TaxID=1894 RepID=UPI0036F498A1
MAKRTARQEIERAFHVSFKLPEQAAELLDAYRAEVREELAAEIDAAIKQNLAEHPNEPAMSARRLGLAAAARIARDAARGDR